MEEKRLLKVFEKYVKKYGMSNKNIKVKYFHSLKVMELCRDIAMSLQVFTDEEIVLCEAIGLFHEIGYFSESPSSHICVDEENLCKKTIDVLFEEGLFRNVIKDTKYDELIKYAIVTCDTEKLPEGSSNKIKHICQIIKDAHRIDMFRMVVNYPYLDTVIEESPHEDIYEKFCSYYEIMDQRGNDADKVLIYLSRLFSLNYKYSFYIIKEYKYVDELFNLLSYNEDDIKTFFEQIKCVLLEYIDRKVGVIC